MQFEETDWISDLAAGVSGTAPVELRLRAFAGLLGCLMTATAEAHGGSNTKPSRSLQRLIVAFVTQELEKLGKTHVSQHAAKVSCGGASSCTLSHPPTLPLPKDTTPPPTLRYSVLHLQIAPEQSPEGLGICCHAQMDQAAFCSVLQTALAQIQALGRQFAGASGKKKAALQVSVASERDQPHVEPWIHLRMEVMYVPFIPVSCLLWFLWLRMCRASWTASAPALPLWRTLWIRPRT